MRSDTSHKTAEQNAPRDNHRFADNRELTHLMDTSTFVRTVLGEWMCHLLLADLFCIGHSPAHKDCFLTIYFAGFVRAVRID